MIDSHCHLDLMKHKDEVIENAKRNGLNAVITLSSSYNSIKRTLQLADRFEGFVFPCIALEYSDVDNLKEAREIILKNKEKIVGIGEVGLDYHWKNNIEKKEEQKENFEFFTELANKLKMPVSVHARDSMKDVFDLLEKKDAENVVMHCFSGTEDELDVCLERDYWVSFATNSCYSKRKQRLINKCSLNNMLIETDSPYLDPDHKNPNEPANVRRVVELIAKLKDRSFDDVDKTTELNTIKAFDLPIRR